MSQTASQPLTIDDLYRLPDDNLHWELVHGRLVSEPSPGARHGRIAAKLTVMLSGYADEHRTGVVLTCHSGFILHRSPDTVRAPDVAWVDRERYLALADEALLVPGAPELAVEVLSPGNREAAVHAKVADYLAAGTTLVWVIDAEAKQVRCYRNLLEPQTLSGVDRLTAEELLPGFSVAVDDIFAI